MSPVGDMSSGDVRAVDTNFIHPKLRHIREYGVVSTRVTLPRSTYSVTRGRGRVVTIECNEKERYRLSEITEASKSLQVRTFDGDVLSKMCSNVRLLTLELGARQRRPVNGGEALPKLLWTVAVHRDAQDGRGDLLAGGLHETSPRQSRPAASRRHARDVVLVEHDGA